jgi:hypothetical protein
MHAGEIAGHRHKRGDGRRDECEAHLARETLNHHEREREKESGKRETWAESGQGRCTGLTAEARQCRGMGSNSEQEQDHNATDRRLYAARKRQRGDGGSAEVKSDGNEVGDRNHLIA